MPQGRCREAADLLQSAYPRLKSQYYFLIMLGEAKGCLSKFDEASNLLARAAQMHPEAHLYIRLGLMLTNAGKKQEAYDAFTHAIELDPSSEDAYLNRGHWFETAHQFDAAINDYRRALALNPGDFVARTHLQLAEQLQKRQSH
jgi:tetratricopeptide (TPR) repeat protein